MEASITLGREHVSIKNIVLVEPVDPERQPPIKSPKNFKARVVLRDNTSILDERTPEELAKALRFRVIPDDNVAINPDRVAIGFRVKTYERKGSAVPDPAKKTDLCWRGPDRREWFRSLKTEPAAVLAVVDAEPEPAPGEKVSPARPPQPRAPRRPEAATPGKK